MGIMVYSLFWVMQDLYHQPSLLYVPSLFEQGFRARFYEKSEAEPSGIVYAKVQASLYY